MNEVWKDIEGYENLYAVSSLGRVKRKNYTLILRNGMTRQLSEKIIKPFIRNNQTFYKCYCVNLSKNHHFKTHIVARLVAIAFIDKPVKSERVIVNHINGKTYDNRVENLEWVTYSENSIHAHRVLKNPANHKTKVINLDTGRIFNTIAEANLFYNKHTKCSNIVSVCKGRRTTAHGYRWKYV